MFAAVNRMACAISPAATSSQRTRPGKIARPAASAEVQPAGRNALERKSNFAADPTRQLVPPLSG